MDQRLRELRRAWHETRAHDEELAYVHALRREGLSRGRLLFAAYAGSAAAAEVLGDAGFALEPDLERWIRGLGVGRLARHQELSRQALVRAALAALGLLATHGLAPDLDELRAATQRWVDCPCATHLAEVGQPLSERSKGPPAQDLIHAVHLSRPLDAARSAALVVRYAAVTLRPVERHNRKALRVALEDTLILWALNP